MYLKSKSFFAGAFVFLSACANIVSPQGGEKDVVPPYAISSNPKDSTVNFNAKKISISFSENIQLKDASKNITISPSVTGGLVCDADRNTLTLKFKALNPATTYTITARNAVADMTEGNVLPSLKYVFSTGDALDSIVLRGRIIDALTLEPCKNTIACLYRDLGDSCIIFSDPDYFTPTNEFGTFALENIHRGIYKLVVIEDKNSNRRWEPGESLGFLDHPINTDSPATDITIRQFKQLTDDNFLLSAYSNKRGVYVFTFNTQDVSAITIDQQDPSMGKRQPYYPVTIDNPCNGDTAKKYVISNLNPEDTAHFNYTLNGRSFPVAIKVSQEPYVLEPVAVMYNSISTETIHIEFLQHLDTTLTRKDRIILIKDTSSNTSGAIAITPFDIAVSKLTKGIYKLCVGKGAITDVFGVTNDSFQVVLNVFSVEDLPTLTLKLDTAIIPGPLFLRLVCSDINFCNTYSIQKGSIFSLSLIPGKYKLYIYDSRSSGLRFRPGHYFRKTQPERILFYKEFDIKPSFDLEETLSISLD
jgi:hypothetical protein